jgi:predicted transcriptional regulator
MPSVIKIPKELTDELDRLAQAERRPRLKLLPLPE